MKEFVNKLQRVRVLVVGDVMLDEYLMGTSNRISPEAPVPVVRLEKSYAYPGAAANVARNLSALGCDVMLIGMIGDDDNGTALTKLLIDANIESDLIINQHMKTITKTRVISKNQQLLRIDVEDRVLAEANNELLTKIKQHIDNFDIIILSDYSKGLLTNPQNIINLAQDRHIPVLVDPKGNDFSKYQGATLLTPNSLEFENIVGTWDDLPQLVVKAKSLIAAYNFTSIIVTLGQDGMVLINDETMFHIPAFAKQVYDVTGAGDTVIAILAMALGSNLPLFAAMELASLAASMVIQKLGAATVSIDELKLAANAHSIGNIVNVDDLVKIISQQKALGKKIIMTNGCFDIVHAGHIAYLKEAKSLGDILIVAVNSDHSVKNLKGSQRPIHCLAHRQAVLAELQSVDYVVDFNEDTPLNIIIKLLPDVLVKGGDYTIANIVGADIVINNGGTVKVLQFSPGLSTTNIINKLQ